MHAAYYEKNGSAEEVLHLGEVETPMPGPGEVRVRLATSGVNPSDVKTRAGTARKIAFPRVIPQSDGAGEIDRVGAGVAAVARRRARVGLEWPVEAPVRDRGPIHRAAAAAGRASAGQDQLRGRCVPRHSGADGASRDRTRRGRGRQDSADRGRRGCGFALRDPVRQGARRDRHQHRVVGGQGRGGARGGRRPHDRLPGGKRWRARDGADAREAWMR